MYSAAVRAGRRFTLNIRKGNLDSNFLIDFIHICLTHQASVFFVRQICEKYENFCYASLFYAAKTATYRGFNKDSY